MPKSATGISATEPRLVPGCRSCHGTGGFTLIEIVVVLFIIGILASIVIVSIARRPITERQHIEATRLEQLLNLAADQAQLQSRQIGLLIGPHQYRFEYLNDKRQWVPYGDGPLRPRKLPKPFEFRLHIEQHAISGKRLTQMSTTPNGEDKDNSSDTDDDTDNGDPHKPPPPQILLLSSGEATAFKLDIIAPHSNTMYRVSSNALADIKLKQMQLR